MSDFSIFDKDRVIPAEMNAEQAIEALKPLAEPSIWDVGATEVAHKQADQILCALLRSLGHGDVVDAWERIDKWYS